MSSSVRHWENPAQPHFASSKLLWTPPRPSTAFASTVRRHINFKRGLNLKNYQELHKYSVENWSFWVDLCESLGIIFSIPPDENNILVSPGPLLPEIPIWFPNARLNYAENLLHRRDDSVVLIESGEQFISPSSGPSLRSNTVSYRQLHALVHEMTSALLTHGLTVGDRVAAITTNSVTSVVLALSVAAIGGIFSSTATDMGVQGILERYKQIKPKFIFAETRVVYAGKEVDLMGKVREVVGALKDEKDGLLEVAVLLPSRVRSEWGKERNVDFSGIKSFTLSQFVKSGAKLASEKPLEFAQLPFNQPLFILYSSGTSGPPKCIVHSAGGVLVNTKKDMRLIFDASGDDTYFQYTTTGWMMWTLMLTGLSCGSRVVLYDGSPFHPTVEEYLGFIRAQGVTSWGTSPRFLSEVQGRGIYLGPVMDGLRVISITGAIVTPALFEWTLDAFGRHIHVVSTSGGTDICASFVTGTGDMAVHAGEIQVKSLGMKVEIFDEAGRNVEASGEAGELVCTRAHVSLPVMFWGDGKGEKLREAYYSTYHGVWRQGDFAAVNPATGGILIFGRSDGVLNPSGVRFGSGEIYGIVEKFGEIEDSICVGQRRAGDGDERVVLFVKMRDGHSLDSQLTGRIRTAIRDGLSGRHVPAVIIATPEIPYTVNGKKVELAVKRILNGRDGPTSGTIGNAECLEWYRRFLSSKL